MVGSRWRQWWWVLCFCFISVSLYLHFVQEKNVQSQEVASRLEKILKEKRVAQIEQESLRLQIESQNDPSWIEMILMRDLGVVPDGWLKVHFAK